jgi:hypothetical protein
VDVNCFVEASGDQILGMADHLLAFRAHNEEDMLVVFLDVAHEIM